MQTEGISIGYDIRFILLISITFILEPIPPNERSRAERGEADTHAERVDTMGYLCIYLIDTRPDIP